MTPEWEKQTEEEKQRRITNGLKSAIGEEELANERRKMLESDSSGDETDDADKVGDEKEPTEGNDITKRKQYPTRKRKRN